MKLEMGRKAKDKITGFTGYLTGRAEYITGCNQWCLNPQVKDDGTKLDAIWLDEGRIEPLDEIIKIQTVQAELNGGPNPDAPICN